MKIRMTILALTGLFLSQSVFANSDNDPCVDSQDKFSCLTNAIATLEQNIEDRLTYLAQEGPQGLKGDTGEQGEQGDRGEAGDNINTIQVGLNLNNHIDQVKALVDNVIEPYIKEHMLDPLIILTQDGKTIRRHVSMINVNPSLMTGSRYEFTGNGIADLHFPLVGVDSGSPYVDEFIREEDGQDYQYTFVDGSIVREALGAGDGTHVSYNPCSHIGFIPGYCTYNNPERLLTDISLGLYFSAFDTSILLPPPDLGIEEQDPIIVSGLDYRFGFKLWDDFNDPLTELTLDYITTTIGDLEEGLVESLLQTQSVTIAHTSICRTLPHHVDPTINCPTELADYDAVIAQLGEYIEIIDGFSSNSPTENREFIIQAVQEDAVFQSLMVTGFTSIYIQYRNGEIILDTQQQSAMDNYEEQLGRYILAFQNQWKLEAQYMYEVHWNDNPSASFADLFASPTTPDIAEESKQLMVDRMMLNQPAIVSDIYSTMQAQGYDATAALPLFSVAFSTAATTLAVGSAAFTDAALTGAGGYVTLQSLIISTNTVTGEIARNSVNALTYVKGFGANIGRATGVGIIVSTAILIAMEGGEQAFAQGDRESRYNALMALDSNTVPDLSTLSDEQIANSIYGWLMLELGLDAFE